MKYLLFICLTSIPIISGAQVNIEFDFKNNKVYRKYHKVEKIAGLNKYQYKTEEHKVFRPLKIGTYLTFEFTNIDSDPRVDSISARYEFLDLNLGHRDYLANYFTNDLKVLNGTGSAQQKSGDDDELSASNKRATTGRMPASIGEYTEEIDSEVRYPFQMMTKWFADSMGYRMEDFDLMLYENFELQQPTDTLFDEEIELELIAASRINRAIENDSSFADSIFHFLTDQTGIEITFEDYLNSQLNQKLGIELDKEDEETDTESSTGTADSRSHQDKDGKKLKEIKYHPLQIENRDLTIIYVEAFNKKRGKLYERRYQFHNRWGFKADFSVGLGISFLKDHIFDLKPSMDKDTSYFLDNFVETDSIVGLSDQNQINQQDDGNFFAGVSVLAHFYTRMLPRANLGLTTGLMINTDSRVNYLFGGSLLFGKEQRLVGTIGVALGKVKRLAEIYEADLLVPATVTSVQTKDKWEHGLYIGFSYNF